MRTNSWTVWSGQGSVYSKDKALDMLRLTGDVEKTARMSGIPGRTPRRWAAAAAKRGHEQKAGPITSAQIGVCMHTKEHVEPLIVRVSA